MAGLLEGTVISVVTAFLRGAIDFVTMLLSGPGSLFDPYWLTNQAVADAGIVRGIGLLVIGVSVAWVGIRTQIGRAARLPTQGGDLERMVLSLVMVLGSVWLCQQMLDINNAITIHFLNLINHNGPPMASIGAALSALAASLLASGAGVAATFIVSLFGGLGALLLVAMAITTFVLYFIRVAEIVFFTATMPIWSALYALPETSGVVGAAYVELGVSIFQQALGVIAWWLATTLILNTDPGTGWEQAVANLLTVVGMLFILIRIPGVLRRMLSAGTGNRGFVATLAQSAGVASRFPQMVTIASRFPWL